MNAEKQADFAKYIRQLRKSKQLSIADVAERSGISGATISRYENYTRAPKPVNLKRLAVALEVSYESLLSVAGYLDSDVEIPPVLEKKERNFVCLDITDRSEEELDAIEDTLAALLKHFKKSRAKKNESA